MSFCFSNEEAKEDFTRQLEKVKRVMSRRSSRQLDNVDIFLKLFELVVDDDDHDEDHQSHEDSNQRQPMVPMLKNSGVYTIPVSPAIQDSDLLFVCELNSLCELSTSLMENCYCGNQRWMMSGDIRQIGHVLRAVYICQSCQGRKWWASSRIVGDRYIVNQKCVHAFTCAGIIPTQYINFSTFSGIGTIGKGYIKSVYKSQGYIDVIRLCADVSMRRAVDMIKSLQSYVSNDGEWVITDARHDSTANAYHTTVPCLLGR
jgi:hypothetical protein